MIRNPLTLAFNILAILFMTLALTGTSIIQYAPTVGWIGAIISLSFSLIITLRRRLAQDR